MLYYESYKLILNDQRWKRLANYEGVPLPFC
jgi:hypothetical protein